MARSGIVLVGLRRAEQREDGVAAELLEGAAVTPRARRGRVRGTEPRATSRPRDRASRSGRRADEVDEDRGDDLALLARRRRGGKGTPAEAAQPELRGIRFATRWADGGLRLRGLSARQLRGPCRRSRTRGELVGDLSLAAAGADLHVVRVYEPIRDFAQEPGRLAQRRSPSPRDADAAARSWTSRIASATSS